MSDSVVRPLAQAITQATKARADYAEGEIAQAHIAVKRALDEMRIAEAALSYEREKIR